MIHSSPAPGGEPVRCPVCRNVGFVEPSTPPGDAPCPFCGVPIFVRPGRRLRLLSPRLGLSLALVAGVLLMLAGGAFAFLGLGLPEVTALVLLAVVLFGRELPSIGRRFGRSVWG